MSTSRKYQVHIDGLRAAAVLSVIFYHYGLTAFNGGYVGVDVFFVISGFLITRLILDEIDDAGEFNFQRFYIRRMRRLLPALLTTLAFSLVLAMTLFTPEQFIGFGGALAATVLSVSNIFFWTESGYFDVDSHLKPLLHTWSLSVEEQFYLFWPALLWLITRYARNYSRPVVLGVVGLTSLSLNHVWVVGNFDVEYASSIFYLTPFRIFELTLGGLAIFFMPLFASRRWLNEAGMALGLILIAYSVYTYTNTIIFPYYYALLPCIGAFFVILSGNSRLFGFVLVSPISVGIGLISYSMYLIHWPLLVFYEYYKFDSLDSVEYISLFIITLFLSILMYFFVEKPFRKSSPTRFNDALQKSFIISTISVMAVICLIGLQINASSGWEWRNNYSLSSTAITEGKNKRYKLFNKGCSLLRLNIERFCDRTKRYQILVIGDSHETDGYNSFMEVYSNNQNVNVIYFGTLNNCDVQMNDSGLFSRVTDRHCDSRVEMLNNVEFIKSLDGLVYSSNKPFIADKKMTWRIIHQLRNNNENLPIVVMGGYINTRRACSELINRFHSFDVCRKLEFVSNDPFNERTASEIDIDDKLEYLYIDKTYMLCSSGEIDSCVVAANGEPAFYDTNHLSLGFATYVGEQIVDFYTDELKSIGFPAVNSSEH